MPALICSVPFLAFGYFFLADVDSAFTQIILAQAIGGIGMMAAMFLFLAFTSRHIGTWLQDVMFNGGARFPTTLFLLERDNTLSNERKRQIRDKVEKDFDVELTNRADDTAQNRQRIGEAVSHIRKKFFGKAGLALQRNIEFGISKNIAGGAIIALAVSLLIVIVSAFTSFAELFYLGLFMVAVYAILAVFGVIAMRTNAKRYATALFEEYLAS